MQSRRILFTTLWLVVFEACADTPAPREALVRVIESGKVAGALSPNGSHAWLGVPYAAPPVGQSRWRPPQSVQPWRDVYPAHHAMLACLQFVSPLTAALTDSDGDGVVGSEDCLYLNIYAASAARDGDKLPVMFWIFGGGSTGGYAGQLDGSRLAQSQNVVVVTVNYRLGPFGWFRHPALWDGTADGAGRSGNWANLDLEAALRWVARNVSQFGGDPTNVTLFGQSAGAQNVLGLMLSPGARGLFTRAIAQSGLLNWSSVADAENFSDDAEPGWETSSREIVNRLLIRDGRAKERGEAKRLQLAMSHEQIRQLLYAQDGTALLKLYRDRSGNGYSVPVRIADGSVLPREDHRMLFETGRFNHVPVILGSTRDEWRIYQWDDAGWTEVRGTSPSDYTQYLGYENLQFRRDAVDSLARAMSASQPGRVFAYRFDWDEVGELDGTDLVVALGASHSFDVPFVFGDWRYIFYPAEAMFPKRGARTREALSRRMMAYWAHFARHGYPGRGTGGRAPEWRPWSNATGGPKVLLLDTTRGGGIRMSADEVDDAAIRRAILRGRFRIQRLHCEAYVRAFRGEHFHANEYESLGREGCRQFRPAELNPP